MRRKRVTGRFFIFLLALLVIAFLILRPLLFRGVRETVVMMANASQRQTVDCIIIRDEAVTAADSAARVEYIAAEDSLVAEGDNIANIYATGYSESLLNNLENTRKNIQDYHKQLLANIVDADLNRLDAVVNLMALEFKNLITRRTTGNLKTVTGQLQTARNTCARTSAATTSSPSSTRRKTPGWPASSPGARSPPPTGRAWCPSTSTATKTTSLPTG